jgi:hypothetical protein
MDHSCPHERIRVVANNGDVCARVVELGRELRSRSTAVLQRSMHLVRISFVARGIRTRIFPTSRQRIA